MAWRGRAWLGLARKIHIPRSGRQRQGWAWQGRARRGNFNMDLKLLPIKEIRIDENTYPRIKSSWHTAWIYSQEMQAGANFPPIEVARINDKWYLIDGKHRLEAMKLNKEEFIQAIHNTQIKTFQQIFLESIIKNRSHGQKFTVQDKISIALKLRDLQIKDDEISKLIQVPITKLTYFIQTRVTNTISGDQIILKPNLTHLAGIEVSDQLPAQQQDMAERNQIGHLTQFQTMLENNLFDLTNPEITKKLYEIKKTLSKIKLVIKQ